MTMAKSKPKAVTEEDLATACAAADISIEDLRNKDRRVDLVARRSFVIFQLNGKGYQYGPIGAAVCRDRCTVLWALNNPVMKAPPSRAEIEAVVEKMWVDNQTAKTIADRVTARLGIKFSREAVLGMVDRHGWLPSDPAAKTAELSRREDKQASRLYWSDGAKAKIKARYLLSRNAREVADALNGRLDGGRPLTRIAVVSLANRYNWPRPIDMAVPRGRPARTPPPKKEYRPFVLPGGPGLANPKPGQAVAPMPVLSAGEGVDLLDLADNGCRHIIGQWGGASRYCGKPCPERATRRAGQSRYQSYCFRCTGELGNVEKPIMRALQPADRLFLASQLRGA
jgi:hypothetical protein